MTKDELISDLAEKNWVKRIVSQTITETLPDGTEVWLINMAEVLAEVATFKNITIYVFDPGMADEEAYYKDRTPTVSVTSSEFKQWVEDQIDIDPEIPVGRIRKISQEREAATVEGLDVDPNDPDNFIMAAWFAWRDVQGCWNKRRISVDPNILAQTAQTG